jgi:predicted nucleic acid-binding protein
VRQEVLSGIKHDEQFEKVRVHLAAFPDEPISSHDYVRAAQLDNLCRKAGVRCGEVDMLLCALAERNGWTILTNDGGLMGCIEVIERVVFGTDERMSGRKLHE